MVGFRFIVVYLASVGFALLCVQGGRTQSPLSSPCGVATCKIYSLADLGSDPDLCKWIAATIPEMIQPKSWKDGQHKLSYHAPSKVLVVCQTPSVHAQVDEFLQNLKKSLPRASAHDPLVMPAQHAVPDHARQMPMAPFQASYPVPLPPQAPKHLFHFIIRYEGEGIIDSNVVNFAKSWTQESGANAVRHYAMPMNAPMADMGVSFEPPPPPAYGLPPTGPTGCPPAFVLPPSSPTGSSPQPAATTRPRMPLADAPPSLPPSLPRQSSAP